VVKIAIDLKIFELVAASDGSTTLDHLQNNTGAAKVLLGRILRYLASFNLIKETDVDSFTSTNATKALANPANQAGIIHQ
jgi:demethylsterigmatocystin 6-O-methyltransferase